MCIRVCVNVYVFIILNNKKIKKNDLDNLYNYEYSLILCSF